MQTNHAFTPMMSCQSTLPVPHSACGLCGHCDMIGCNHCDPHIQVQRNGTAVPWGFKAGGVIPAIPQGIAWDPPAPAPRDVAQREQADKLIAEIESWPRSKRKQAYAYLNACGEKLDICTSFDVDKEFKKEYEGAKS